MKNIEFPVECNKATIEFPGDYSVGIIPTSIEINNIGLMFESQEEADEYRDLVLPVFADIYDDGNAKLYFDFEINAMESED